MDKRIRAKKVWQKRVAGLAAYSRKSTVNNCTIPKINNTEAVWDANEWYTEQREAAKKENKEYRFSTKRKKPWYILDTRKRYHYEEHKTSYGSCVDYFRVLSEATEMYNKTSFRPNKGIAWYMEQVVQHKLAKWEKKNPCPVKEDQNPPDIFEQEYIVPWKAKRELALERIRNFVVSVYDKLPLTGRFKESEEVYKEKLLTTVKDKNGDGHDINHAKKDSALIKKVQKFTNKIYGKRSNLVCTNLKDHMRKRGRLFVPETKKAA